MHDMVRTCRISQIVALDGAPHGVIQNGSRIIGDCEFYQGFASSRRDPVITADKYQCIGSKPVHKGFD